VEANGLDPLTIANQGLLSNDPCQVAAQGLLHVRIDIVDPEDEIIIPDTGGGIVDNDIWKRKTKEEKKKLRAKITVSATVDGITYEEIKYSNDCSITVQDVDIQVVESTTKPKITIEVKKK
jgi:3D (Asp-Asp-Asp) domain-containing protein